MTNDLKPLCTVATASAIIADKDDPYRILVADSAKHPFPVIPGGKVELIDAQTAKDDAEAALRCVLREVEEEVGTGLLDPHLIGVARDATRDVRTVPAKKVKPALTSPALPEGLAEDEKIVAAYGCPDYIYTGLVDTKAIQNTEELKGQRFIDIRTLKTGELSVGHDVIVLWYRDMLDKGAAQIDPSAMKNFEEDRKLLSGPARERRAQKMVELNKKPKP